METGHYWFTIMDEKHLILCKTEEVPGNWAGTVELVEGGALQAGDGGEGKGQHCGQEKKKQHFPEKQHINHIMIV